MNVLVTYFSQTGNTEKIAKAICEEVATANSVELKKLEDITPADVAGYDCIFVGSPLHSGSLAAPVQECLGILQATSNQKLAAFITHFAPAYPDQDMDGFTKPIKVACEKRGIEFKGSFDCQGFLAEPLHGPVQQKLGLTDEQWTEMVTQMTGRPNGDDEAKAKAFAKAVLA
jgi:flavodoxin